MVRFFADLPIEADGGKQTTTPPSKLKSSNELLSEDFNFEFLPENVIPGIDDLSLTPVNCLSDFDSIRDWIDEMQAPDSVGICPKDEIHDGFVELSEEAKCPGEKDGFFEAGDGGRIVSVNGDEFVEVLIKEEVIEDEVDGSKMEKDGLSYVRLENCGGVAGLGGMGAVVGDELKKRETEGGGSKILGSLGRLIEEGIGKVSLLCDSQRSLSQEDKMEGIVTVNDEDDGDSSSQSESDISSSASPSESASSSENEGTIDDDDDINEEKKEEEEDEGFIKEKMVELQKSSSVAKEDMEEGEIQESDADNMADWSNDDQDDNDEEKSRGFGNYDEDDNDDEDYADEMKGPIRSKNELQVLPPVPPVNVSLQPFHQMLPVGVVSSIIGAQVIVEGVEKHNPLSEGSILWETETRRPLGLVDEIFGPVKNPYYIVRYNSEGEVPSGIHQGTSVSFVQEFAHHVLNNQNLYQKGYDASGENDEEVDYEVEFSDDEEEAEYYRMLKMSKRKNNQRPGNRKPNGRNPRSRDRRSRNTEVSMSETPKHAGSSRAIQTQQNHVSVSAMSMHNNDQSIMSGSWQAFNSVPVGVSQFPPRAQTATVPRQPHNMQCHNGSAPVTSVNHGNQLTPTVFSQLFPASPVPVLGFPQLAQPAGITPSGSWTPGFQFRPQNIVFPNGIQMNALPLLQQNPLQAFPMQLPNAVPFQLQFSPSQGFPSTSTFPFQPVNSSQLGVLGPSISNQAPVGIGFPGHFPQLPAPGVVSSEPLAASSSDLGPPPPGFTQNIEAAPQFSLGASSNRSGRQVNRRGPRFGCGIGRQQR